MATFNLLRKTLSPSWISTPGAVGSALGEWLGSGSAAKWGSVQGLSTGREAGEAAAEEWNAILRPWGREARLSLVPVACV